MDISILNQLQQFESEEESWLEEKKKAFLNVLEGQRKKIIEQQEMELYLISLNRHDRLKKEEQSAKEKSADYVKSFQERIAKLKESSARIESAADFILREFKNV